MRSGDQLSAIALSPPLLPQKPSTRRYNGTTTTWVHGPRDAITVRGLHKRKPTDDDDDDDVDNDNTITDRR